MQSGHEFFILLQLTSTSESELALKKLVVWLHAIAIVSTLFLSVADFNRNGKKERVSTTPRGTAH